MFDMPTPYPPQWHVMKAADLAKTMLSVMAHPEEARARAAKAREYTQRHLTWAGPRKMVEDRIVALASRLDNHFVRGGPPFSYKAGQ